MHTCRAWTYTQNNCEPTRVVKEDLYKLHSSVQEYLSGGLNYGAVCCIGKACVLYHIISATVECTGWISEGGNQILEGTSVGRALAFVQVSHR